ncbi:beta family protein [Methylobacterium bullatum]|uniref:Beta protein n=1 Tax=Methylobacterium bullatum TaxID=570505 RepID=A0AAV4Z8K8_9HYPH|nr:beta family protein [Methylobacterium bullatum]MBD8902827.1 hypothetical protein [Methylobacterium bullatum]GJD39928.1 hypothetical protein OICFNHDK_2392 [Methylobacterium bullatum]
MKLKNGKPLLYVPALRLKQGECRGLWRLAPDVADKILPRLVVPPPKDIDPEHQRLLTKDEIVYGTGRRIADSWHMREALLDVTYLFKEFGEDESHQWLPRLFSVARDNHADVIPVLTIKDTLSVRAMGFRQALRVNQQLKAALRVTYDEVNSELGGRLKTALKVMGLQSQDCMILVDFAEADFSAPELVADVVQGAVEDLQRLGRWQSVVFQGTNYPDKNPAVAGDHFLVPRNEWLAWQQAIKLDAKSPEQLVFGDYGADCATFEFRKVGGGIPIRHYRYTTPDSLLVVRGADTGKNDVVMPEVAARVVSGGHFAGREFSSADDLIFQTAKRWVGPGNGTTWREINTTHHITRVVRDIGKIKGISFRDRLVSTPAMQTSLFEN